MLYEYECRDCKRITSVICSVNERDDFKKCECGGRVDRFIGQPMVVGTRDNFGIKNEFRDDSNGQTIDNWKSWEKAGYRNPLETTKNHSVKEKIKEQIEKKKGK